MEDEAQFLAMPKRIVERIADGGVEGPPPPKGGGRIRVNSRSRSATS